MSFLPDMVTHFIVVAGALGIIISLIMNGIPFVVMYRIAIQVISVLLLGFGLYLEGGLSNEAAWQEKVTKLEAKLVVAQAESKIVNEVVVTKVVTEIKYIRSKAKTITEYVDREITKFDKTCPIPAAVVTAHNAAAKNNVDALVTEMPLTATTVIPTADFNALARKPIKMAPKK